MTGAHFTVRWSDLGCPTEPGTYDYDGFPIIVRSHHVEGANNDPDTIFTVISVRPVSGPEQFALGGFVREDD
jgi:hypothetical protein